MIGREGDVKPFELIRWARAAASRHSLKPLEAHVLLVLATYANADGIAWPSVKTLALDCGLRPTSTGRNSSVSAAISRLEELQLVWTKQAGHGQPAKRELLFNPAAEPSGRQDGRNSSATPQPSVSQDGSASSVPSQPSDLQDAAVRQAGPEVPVERPVEQLPNRTARGSHPAGRTASHPDNRTGDLRRLDVLGALRSHLDPAGAPA